jgi:hypothetical protein
LEAESNCYSPVVVLTTSKTTTSWMLAVLSYTTVTGGYMTTVLAGLRETGRHGVCKIQKNENQDQQNRLSSNRQCIKNAIQSLQNASSLESNISGSKNLENTT